MADLVIAKISQCTAVSTELQIARNTYVIPVPKFRKLSQIIVLRIRLLAQLQGNESRSWYCALIFASPCRALFRFSHTNYSVKLTKDSNAFIFCIECIESIFKATGWRPRSGRVSTGPQREQKRSHTAEFIRKKNTFNVTFFKFFRGWNSILHDF